LGEIWGARDGVFEWAKSEKSGEVKILPLCTAGGKGGDGITSVMGGARLPHLRGVWGKIGGACPTATSADF
jgi:hypothetical protein